VLSNEVHNRFAETDVEVPSPSIVPLGRGRHHALNLRGCG
jgi:hypothetical protein